MSTTEIRLQRLRVVSSRPFDEVVQRLTDTIGHPEMNAFHDAVAATTTAADLQEVVQSAIGSSGLMEFACFDAGAILGKERTMPAARLLRLIVGNPLIMKEM